MLNHNKMEGKNKYYSKQEYAQPLNFFRRMGREIGGGEGGTWYLKKGSLEMQQTEHSSV
jgi:hypothetical protein